jgi:hypothetical protein
VRQGRTNPTVIGYGLAVHGVGIFEQQAQESRLSMGNLVVATNQASGDCVGRDQAGKMPGFLPIENQPVLINNQDAL